MYKFKPGELEASNKPLEERKTKRVCLGCLGEYEMTVSYCSDCNNRLTSDMRPKRGVKTTIRTIIANAIHITQSKVMEEQEAPERAPKRITPKGWCPICHTRQKYGVLCKSHWDMCPEEHRPMDNQDMSGWEFYTMKTYFDGIGETKPWPKRHT